MAKTYMTPGVYIEEKNAFPNSAVAVETAVPVFIGHTEKAGDNARLLSKPTRITSLAEYLEKFGGAFKAQFDVTGTGDVKVKDGHATYLYNSVRLFYVNGGSACYILSVGLYEANGITVRAEEFVVALDILKKEPEPTLVVIPDAVVLGTACYSDVYTKVLQHCHDMQNRFAILDILNPVATEDTERVIATFRDEIGSNYLNYGAAYYPWLNTTIVDTTEFGFANISATIDLEKLITEEHAIKAIKKYKAILNPDQTAKNYLENALRGTSAYNKIIEAILYQLNQLPPSGAIAGIYTAVDTNRGVWKAPANVSVNMVNSPSVNVSHDEQQNLNVDMMAGKSINVIRAFPGVGTLVWGGRTLDGNSQDWRYINVRRTLIMIEQSLKLAARAYVFEPNDASTWITIKSMFNNFLTSLWKQGALAGAAPEQAFDVQIGLGATMTPTDILDGRMIIAVMVAIVRPAEFIPITFQQQMQQS